MFDRLNIFKLGQCRTPQLMRCLTGGIGNEVQMKFSDRFRHFCFMHLCNGYQVALSCVKPVHLLNTMTGAFVKAGFVLLMHDYFHRKVPLLIKFIHQVGRSVKLI